MGLFLRLVAVCGAISVVWTADDCPLSACQPSDCVEFNTCESGAMLDNIGVDNDPNSIGKFQGVRFIQDCIDLTGCTYRIPTQIDPNNVPNIVQLIRDNCGDGSRDYHDIYQCLPYPSFASSRIDFFTLVGDACINGANGVTPISLSSENCRAAIDGQLPAKRPGLSGNTGGLFRFNRVQGHHNQIIR